MKRLWIVLGLFSLATLTALYGISRELSTSNKSQPMPLPGNYVKTDPQMMLETAVRKNPGDYQARYDLATFYAVRGDLEKAIREFQESLKLKPDSWEGHYNLGIAYYDQGYTDQAIIHYKEAVELKGDEADIHFNLALAYVQARYFDLAVTEYQEALRFNPKNIAIHNNLGNLYRFLNHPDLAIQEYKAALKLDPNDIRANYNLAVTLDLMGKALDGKPYYAVVITMANQTKENSEYQYYAEKAQSRLSQLN